LGFLDDRQVLRGRTFLSVHDVEFDSSSLVEALEALSLDRTVVAEDILLAIITGEEAEALFVIEPFDCTNYSHLSISFEF
jgi:hypothetical protein